MSYKHLVMGDLAQFADVGARVGLGGLIIRFAEYQSPGIQDKDASLYTIHFDNQTWQIARRLSGSAFRQALLAVTQCLPPKVLSSTVHPKRKAAALRAQSQWM